MSRLLPLDQLSAHVAKIGLVASDVDGTITRHECLTPELLGSLVKLQQANVPLLLVTGRSAGWVDALRSYLPVVGAIAENGGIYFPKEGASQCLSPITDLASHRQKLKDTFEQLQHHYSHLQETTDNVFRLTDWTFEVAGLSQNELEAIARQCQDWGWSFTFSTVQCHIKPALQTKAWGIQQVLQQHFLPLDPTQVLTVGDSPNDETMFDPDVFPLSVGVANLLNYRDRMVHLPRFVTNQPEAQGFCELVDRLLIEQ